MPVDGWRIVPDGVRTVLTSVAQAAETLGSTVDALPAHVESAIAATAQSPVIADALSGFFEHHEPTLEAIGHRVNAAVGGASAATMWYVHGDGDMAAQQQAAASSVLSGPVTFSLPPEAQQ